MRKMLIEEIEKATGLDVPDCMDICLYEEDVDKYVDSDGKWYAEPTMEVLLNYKGSDDDYSATYDTVCSSHGLHGKFSALDILDQLYEAFLSQAFDGMMRKAYWPIYEFFEQYAEWKNCQTKE